MYETRFGLSLALAACVLLSVAAERFAEPDSRIRGRPAAAWCVHFGSVLLCFTMLLALSARPFFATALSMALWASLVVVNNAKFRALREPFVFTDFALFSQALRYPRLYLPFLGWRPIAAGGLIAVSACYLGVATEPTLMRSVGMESFLWIIGSGLLASAMLLVTGVRNSAPPILEPQADVQQLGLLTSLWLYRLAEAGPLEPPTSARFGASSMAQSFKALRGDPLPDLIVVQSESFFDARRLWPTIRPDVLQGFDRIKAESLSGRLAVPAWGANTMRTEFAFLSGIPAQALGVHRFNPFRRYARRPVPGIAHDLRGRGYRTICIHPHPIGFFGRDRVYPNLGFDRFIDIEGFRDAEKVGPYVGDAAVALKIAEILSSEPAPVFVFAITMENHGPLHLEKVSADDEDALYLAPPPQGFEDLTVYLRHLANADRMLTDLTRLLTESGRESRLCFFGDHVPSMPDVYRRLDFSDASTDYLIWCRGMARPVEWDIDVDALGSLLLDAAGLRPRSIVPSR